MSAFLHFGKSACVLFETPDRLARPRTARHYLTG
jgi:hypothetical protein